MDRTSNCFDLVIVGGGIVGATLAAALKSSGLRIAIVDRLTMDEANQRPRAYALSLLSQKIFQCLGLWEAIAPTSGYFRRIQLSDEDFPHVVHFSPRDLHTEFLGYAGQHGTILKSLQDYLHSCDHVQWFCPAQVTAVDYAAEKTTVTLTMEGQQHILESHLIVGADGAKSRIRQEAGIRTKGWKYWQSCVTCVVEHQAPRNDIAYERFWRTGPMGVLPLPGHRCQIVWTNPHAEAQRLQNLDEAEFIHLLEKRTGKQLGALTLVGDRQVFPVQLMQSDRYVKPRLALIGDAAHCCHPVGGQGLNLGIRDAAALAQILTEAHQHHEDIGSIAILKRYERWRKLENLTILGFTDFLDRLFSNQFLPVVWLRRLGLILMAKVNPIRLFALQLMTGQRGKTPQIALQK